MKDRFGFHDQTPVGLRYKQRAATLDTYILAPQGAVQGVLMDRWPLVADFARGAADAGQVLLDALLEVAVSAHPNFGEARRAADKKGLSCFWFGLAGRGHIRQRVQRTGRRGHGWREVTETARVHRAMRRTAPPISHDTSKGGT